MNILDLVRTNRWRLVAVGGFVLAATALPSGCDDHIIGSGAPIVMTCLRDPPLTYENFGDGILDRHCNSCHSVYSREGQRGAAPLEVNFDNWEDILVWAERIQARSIDDSTMPPSGGTLIASERLLLAEWMRCEVLPAIGQIDLQGTEPGDAP